jgi:ribose transport system substrate-binding protein
MTAMRFFAPLPSRALLLVILTIAGCGDTGASKSNAPSVASSTTGGSDAAASASQKGTVGVSLLTLTNPFFRVIGDNIAAELKKAGYETVVVSGEFDVAAQRGQVKDFITAGHAAIVLCPCDSRAVGAAIREANEAGIPVFTADLGCLDPDAKVVSHIATDNYSGGKQAGEAMIEALGEAGGKVVILDFAQAESCNLRVKGFKEVIAAHNETGKNGKTEIVAELPGNGKTDDGYKAAEDALQSHPDLAGIFAINDPSALGAWAALDKAGKAGQVKLVGFDGQPDGKQAIKDGKIFADPIQHPDQIGKTTAQSILKYLAGEEVEPQQLIPTALYKQADGQADPELK